MLYLCINLVVTVSGVKTKKKKRIRLCKSRSHDGRKIVIIQNAIIIITNFPITPRWFYRVHSIKPSGVTR